MLSRFRCSMILLVAAFLLGGCYHTPVRNLASDAVLIKPGQSTRNDVLTFLGEPDEQQTVGEGVEKWLYREEQSSSLERAPLVGKYFGKPGYGRVVVTLKGDTVVDITYDAHDDDEEGWADDYSWQEGKEK